MLYTIDHTGCCGCLREIILCNYYYMIVDFNCSIVNSTNLLVVFSMQWTQKRCTTSKNTSHEHSPSLQGQVDRYSFTRWVIHVPRLNYECMHCMHGAAMFLIHDTCMQIGMNIPFIYKYHFMHVMCMHAGQAHCMHPKCMLIKTTEMF